MEEYTIETLAAELGIDRPVLKEILELQSTMPNATLLTSEQVETVRAAIAPSGATSAPPTAAKAPTAAPKPAEKDEVVFCWPKMKKAAFSIGRRDDDGNLLPAIRRQAVNGVMRLSKKNKEDAIMIAHLRKHGANQANGGTRFAEFKGSIEQSGTKVGGRIQELLMAMQPRTLTQLAADCLDGDLVKAQLLPVGDQIALVLGLNEE